MTVRAAERMIVRSPEPEVTPMARKAQLSLEYAVDLWLGELARQGRAATTRRKYRETLDPFCAAHEHLMPAEITTDHLRRFLDRWSNHSASTLALHVTVIRGFFGFLAYEDLIPRNPAERIKRPRRPRPEDVEVVSVSRGDVRRMFEAAESWQELLCLAVLAYTGVRRRAAARVRVRDVDFDAGTIGFREKGGKFITKPMPHELAALLRAARDQNVWAGPDDWLIPNRKPWLVRSTEERGHKVIYETVVKVAERAGVRSHVHALRAAFAVQYNEAHPGELLTLQELLGHAHLETTKHYLRRRDRARAMESVRDLSWGSNVFPANAAIPPAGFEPALRENADATSDPAATDADHAVDWLLARARELSLAAKAKGRVQA